MDKITSFVEANISNPTMKIIEFVLSYRNTCELLSDNLALIHLTKTKFCSIDFIGNSSNTLNAISTIQLVLRFSGRTFGIEDTIMSVRTVVPQGEMGMIMITGPQHTTDDGRSFVGIDLDQPEQWADIIDAVHRALSIYSIGISPIQKIQLFAIAPGSLMFRLGEIGTSYDVEIFQYDYQNRKYMLVDFVPRKSVRYYSIFLSYKRDNSDVMKRIKVDLEQSGYNVWTDEKIEPGTSSWKVEIEREIERSDCIVCLMSPEAKQSKWVRAELDYASMLEKRIFLLLIDGNEKNSIPFDFITSQWIDIRDDNLYRLGMLKLIDTLNLYLNSDV